MADRTPAGRDADPRLTALADQWHQVAIHAHRVAMGYEYANLTGPDLAALKTALTGAMRLQAELAKDPEPPMPVDSGLTERQWQVLHKLADGSSLADIAQELGVSTETVRTHATHLYRKLGAANRAHAVILAVRAGILR